MVQHNFTYNVNRKRMPFLSVDQWFHNLLGVLIKNQDILTPSYGTTLPRPFTEMEAAEWLRFKASEILRNNTVISRYSRLNLDEQMKKDGTSVILTYQCDPNDVRNQDPEIDYNNCKGCLTKVFRIFITACERDKMTKIYGEDLTKSIADLLVDMMRFSQDQIRVETLDGDVFGFLPSMVDVDSPVALPEPSNSGEGGYYTVSIAFAIPMSVFLTVDPTNP